MISQGIKEVKPESESGTREGENTTWDRGSSTQSRSRDVARSKSRHHVQTSVYLSRYMRSWYRWLVTVFL